VVRRLHLELPDMRPVFIPAKRKSERRQNVRFPMVLAVHYSAARKSGWGQILDIGSGGALFTIDQPLKLGQRVDLCIAWPVLLHEKVHLNLIAVGVIVRVEEGRAAIRFERCSFRTSSSAFRRHALSPVAQSAESHA
jgi:hypothetical protein